jgi:hypothetical protein
MPDDHVAGRRAREVYRYFRPEKRLGAILEKETSSSEDNTTSDGLRSSTSSSNREQSPATPPSSAPSQTELVSPPNSMQAMPESLILGDANSTLNSFAQLAALRLDVDRAFISFSDRDSQFIIAQSAQTTDSTNKYDGLSGGIYAGCSTLDVSTWNMCQDTIALPASRREKGDYEFIISNDMAQDDRYQHLPLVQKKPAFRFFAGTPLTTDSGINVGCFFVLDTKPRVAFSEKDKITMGQMGMLIMDFLKVSRQASEGRRASRLTQGMNHFVEGRSSFQSDFDTIKLLNRESSTSSGSRRRLHRRNTGSVSSRFSRSSSASAHSANSDSDAEVPFLASSYHSSHSASWSAEDKANDEMNPEKDTTWTFRRAANLIRESLELGENSGVAFLEAGNNFLPHRTSDSESSSSPENETIASILSISTAETPYGTAQESSVPYPVANMSEDFLHRLLRRHRRGKIFFLHRDGQLSSSDSEDNSKSTDPFGRRDSIKPKNYKAMKAKDNKLLNLYFPSASQVMFVPLLSAAYSQWYGGCFCWNNVESNVFDPSVELSTVVSFGSSIMAECSRIESLISDRQKADFLGSIS